MQYTKKTKNFIDKAFTYLLLTVVSVSFLLPLMWMLMTSLKTYYQNIMYNSPFFPEPIYFENYYEALFDFIPYFKYFFNSVFLVIVGTCATLISATMVAYGFARFKVAENKYLFIVLLSTMMLPQQVTLISSYVVWAKLSLINTYVPLLISSFFGGSAYYIFLIKQFINGISIDFEESATIDGASKARIFLLIVVPLIKPVIAAIAIFSFQGIWNDYMGPLIYIKDSNLYTVAQALTMYDMAQETLWGNMMAASIVTILPIIIVFAFCQKYFISGITFGGVKG